MRAHVRTCTKAQERSAATNHRSCAPRVGGGGWVGGGGRGEDLHIAVWEGEGRDQTGEKERPRRGEKEGEGGRVARERIQADFAVWRDKRVERRGEGARAKRGRNGKQKGRSFREQECESLHSLAQIRENPA